MKHRGEIIKKHIDDLGIKGEVLAKKLVFGGKIRSSRTMYNKLSQPNMSIDDVLAFSRALNHDFSNEIPELKKISSNEFHVVSEPTEEYKKQTDFKDKYVKLLEEQNNLLRKGEANYVNLTEAVFKLASSIKEGISENGNSIRESSKDINDSLILISKMLDQGHVS
jgi:hypothetical protein